MAFPFLKNYDQPDFSALCDEAFFDAIRRMDIESCETFISNRSHEYLLSLVTSEGDSPLHVAVQDNGSIDINDIYLQISLVKRLLRLGYDLRSCNHANQTVLDLAKLNPHPQILNVIDPTFTFTPMEGTTSPPPLSHRNSVDSYHTVDTAYPLEDASHEEPLSVLSPSSSVAALLTRANLQEYLPLFEEHVRRLSRSSIGFPLLQRFIPVNGRGSKEDGRQVRSSQVPD